MPALRRTFPAAAFLDRGGGPRGADALQQGLGAVFTADQFRVLFAPLGGEFAAEGLGEDRLGEVIDAGQGGLNPLFDLVGEGKELFDAVDDLGLFFYPQQLEYQPFN